MKRQAHDIKVPPVHDWRTTDQDEINKRRLRARTEALDVANTDAAHPIFSNFRVKSASGMTYAVEIRDLRQRQFGCECTDFRVNGLGTCKHVEAVLLNLEARYQRLFQKAQRDGSPRIDVVPEAGSGALQVERGLDRLPVRLRQLFDERGVLRDGAPDAALELLAQADVTGLRISQEVAPWLEARRQTDERKQLRREYETRVQAGEWPPHETLVPLFPYQREGMLHLAFTERALLADEMGLGKTIQAIAACALLHRLGKARRVLVVTPASLKTEWEEQIQKFTTLPYRLVFGGRKIRLQAYVAAAAPFFTIVNYEQMLRDALDVNVRLRPDVIVLDEAQRIKNWNTKIAQAVKRLKSRYAFVLTGTPIENRIDEIRSLIDFLNPAALGPLFRFNREYYQLDERGKPAGYRNLDQLHARIKPFMLRRRKADVETELPARLERTHFVALSPEQKNRYDDHDAQVAKLASIAKRRPLTQQEQDKLMRELAMMRMTCDTNYILDHEDRTCPKLTELEKILEECRENPDTKVIVFSEWERMLELVRDACQRLNLGFAWHTGSVPQRRRRAEINAFKADASCRVFLSTDSGSVGLNLQNASVVVNCDLPWNPAKLEQRIARAWRKNQTRPVTVVNLVAENTIEHRMLGTLAAKQALAEGVLELRGDLKEIKLTSGRQSFLAKLQQLVVPPSATAALPATPKRLPVDRAKAFCERARDLLRGGLVRCEERYPLDGPHSVVVAVVERDALLWQEKLRPLHRDLFGPGQSDPLAPVNLEVIDRVTDEAINRLVEAGLIARTARVTRSLHPPAEIGRAFSDAERQQAAAHRAKASRKLKLAAMFGQEEFRDEARQAVLEAIHAAAQALAVENRLPEPVDLKDVLAQPWSLHWGGSLPAFREFIGSATGSWQSVGDLLRSAMQPSPAVASFSHSESVPTPAKF
jgi:ERCC4-related helicase